MAIPFYVLGDGPLVPSGLGRIAGDLCEHLWAERAALGIDLYQVGWPAHGEDDGPLTEGIVDWPCWGFDHVGQCDQALTAAWQHWTPDQPGIVLSVWDPSRCLGLSGLSIPLTTWGYFAVDAENLHGGISGPAGDAVSRYARVLAYTAFGARVLLSAMPSVATPVPHLPHGIDLDVFTPERTDTQRARTRQLLGGYVTDRSVVIGCVATNMKRKDFGVFAQALQILRAQGVNAHGWIHTNREISDAWSIPQLALDCELGTHLTVTLRLTDEELAGLYTACAATFAPGRGEGFGYPIVESLACGTPVVHVDYAGGAEWTPVYTRVRPVAYHLEGPYALRMPILDPMDVAMRLRQCVVDDVDQARHRARVADLDWRVLWPHWRQWIAEGLAGWTS